MMNNQVLDPTVFNEMRELMDDALGEFISTYLGNSPRLIDQMEQGLAASDAEAIHHSAHQLKGGSGSIGAMRLYELARQIEQMARDGGTQDIEPLLQELKTEYLRVDAALQEHV